MNNSNINTINKNSSIKSNKNLSNNRNKLTINTDNNVSDIDNSHSIKLKSNINVNKVNCPFELNKENDHNMINSEAKSKSNYDENSKLFYKSCEIVNDYCYNEYQNSRDYMEDYSKIIDNMSLTIPLKNKTETSESSIDYNNRMLILLADGHGGDSASIYVKDQFPLVFKNAVSKLAENYSMSNNNEINLFINNNFEKIIKNTYLELDNSLKNETWASTQGSTLNSVVITSDNSESETLTINCANVGDSRSVLATKDSITRLSYDHKASDKNEKSRVEKEGGFISFGRLLSQLAITRAFGDIEYKEYGLSAEPYVYTTSVKKNNNNFIIVASDGVWDVIEDNELLKIIKDCDNDSQKINKLIIKTSIERGSLDNISCIVVKL